MIDHAWGRESCTIADIKAYDSKAKSISTSQILFEDYSFEKAQIVVKEMVLDVCHKMMRQRVVTNSVTLFIGYSKDVIPPSGGTAKLLSTTHLYSEIIGEVMAVFERTTATNVAIRRIGLSCNNVVGEGCEGYNLFTNFAAIEKEKKAEKAVLSLKDRFGKNCIIRAVDLEEGATAMQRNKLIGGHNE
jgi:DNA polymerase V